MTQEAIRTTQILIVDDDPAVRDLLFDLLSETYNCLRANSGNEALKMLQSERPGLVISDINMPGMSGLDLIPLVITQSPDTVVMMISGNQTIDNAIDAIRAGAFDFIKKPFDLDQVEVAVRRAMEHHSLLTQKRRHDEELEVLVEERTKQLNYLAFYDALTGLPNRTRFEEQLATAIADPRLQTELALLIVAPDRFMDMRDTLGDAISEDILKTFSERLQATMGDGSVVGRLDTAEFGVILRGTADPAEVIPTIEKLFRSLAQVFHFSSHDIFISAAVGVTTYPRNAEDAKTLIKNAGMALSQARAAGTMSFKFFTAEMHDKALQRLTLGNELRHAAVDQQLVVHYQPKVNTKTGEIVGLESLVRWHHPRIGLVSPADFIPIAEETGSIIDIGKWVLRETCEQVGRWHGEGYALSAAVNVSPMQFDSDLATTVNEIIQQTGFPAVWLNLEVTESSIMKNSSFAVRTLNELKAVGVKVSIDDFGTGYSSLGQLRSLPVDVLKIDKSFIDEIARDSNDASMVKSIIDLAHSLDLKVVAEGVETEDQLQSLAVLHCDEWQGFLSSRPLPAHEFYELLNPGSKANARQIPIALPGD
ncbi:MAG TPA: EAL domain-containing protein [Pyrinomonadaceae bacterium]|jgi:diguanylate cyclase (GGDEF)-like protein|nr:EAL domain-containing protein [Pyrinomonadaceae bacterium]